MHLLVRPEYTAWRIGDILDNVHLYEADLTDRESLFHTVDNIRPDWIFHLGVYGAYSWQTDVWQIVQTNIVGTVNLVGACLRTGFEAFVNTGSSSEYGLKDYAPSEDECLEPNSYYAVTKASATWFCRYTAQSQNVQLVTLRLYSVYGPYEHPKRLIPTLIVQGLQGKLPPLVNPDVARDYVYIDDATEAYLLAAAQRDQELGAIYNVGTGVQTSLREVVDIARRVMRVDTKPAWGSMPDRRWDTTVWVADSQRIQSQLGWQPGHTFDHGFRKTVRWFRDDRAVQRIYREELSG